MERIISIFHKVSIIKYPVLILGLLFVYKPLLFESSNRQEDIITGLILLGFGISLDSFSDYRKLNWFDKQVYHKPKRAKLFFIIFGIIYMAGAMISIINYKTSGDSSSRELSLAFLSLIMGCLGMLRSGIQTTIESLKETNQATADKAENGNAS